MENSCGLGKWVSSLGLAQCLWSMKMLQPIFVHQLCATCHASNEFMLHSGVKLCICILQLFTCTVLLDVLLCPELFPSLVFKTSEV